MFAIIQTGGKQIKVSQNDEIFVEKLNVEEGSRVIFDQVLMIDNNIGSPFLNGAAVSGIVLKQGKAKKIRVIRYHPKKNVNKVYGHRQPFTKVKIEEISLTGIKLKPETKKTEKVEVVDNKESENTNNSLANVEENLIKTEKVSSTKSSSTNSKPKVVKEVATKKESATKKETTAKKTTKTVKESSTSKKDE